MKFEEALVELRKGKEIQVQEEDGTPNTIDINSSGWISINSILNGSWKVIKETGKTFPEVFASFKEGEKIKRKSWHYQDSYLKKEAFGTLTCEDLLATDWEVIE